tara:strand:- start:248 stop:1165 length:918 start_codon:yes stop_codon:yes gene_type:complete
MSRKNPFLGLGLNSPFLSFARPVYGSINCGDLPAGRYLDLTAKRVGSITAEESTPRGVFIGNDGTRMFTTGEQGDGVDQYTLSTAWDPSTASFDKFLNVTSVLQSRDVFLSSDGTQLYVLDDFYDRIAQFNLTTPWDLTSTNYNSQYFSLGSDSTVLNPTGLTFSSDGVYMYVMSSYLRYMNRYTLSSPWNISTAGGRQQSSFPASQITNTGQETGIAINNDGTRMVIVHVHGDEIEEYTLSTPYSISSTSHVGSLSIASDSTFPTGICWGNDGQYLYVASSSPNDEIIRYETCSGGAYKILGRP